MLPTLTVFTPTFNRAEILRRLYASLVEQTCRDFKWLVVDDGSTDETNEFVEECKRSAPFAVQYVYQRNAGKHAAINTAISLVDTELVLVVDSDDELLPHAVDLIVSTWTGASDEERARLAGIWTLCLTPDGELLAGPLPHEVVDTSIQELRYNYKIVNDMLRCFATKVWRRYPFPQTPPGVCPYIPEGYVWCRMTLEHPIRFLNVACSRVHYQTTGLSAMARSQYRLSRCVVYAYLQPLDSDLGWFWRAPAFFAVSAIQAARYGLFSGEFRRLMVTMGWKARLLLLASLPIAVLLLARDWLTGRIAREMAPA